MPLFDDLNDTVMTPAVVSEKLEQKEQITPLCALSPLARRTAIIFDYDDTLLASSHLSGQGYGLDSTKARTDDIETGLRALESAVLSVLQTGMRFGHCFIVTNAENGWVQLSAKAFMPGLVPLLDEGRVKVISARSTFESQHPGCPVKWKYLAFQHALDSVFGNDGGRESKAPKNVLSFGDSHVEREAVRSVTRTLTNVKTKSIKFAERPSMEQLRRQIELVTTCFEYIFGHEGDLDLQLTVTVNSPTGAAPAAAGNGAGVAASAAAGANGLGAMSQPVPGPGPLACAQEQKHSERAVPMTDEVTA
jgi:hypothetical protein